MFWYVQPTFLVMNSVWIQEVYFGITGKIANIFLRVANGNELQDCKFYQFCSKPTGGSDEEPTSFVRVCYFPAFI